MRRTAWRFLLVLFLISAMVVPECLCYAQPVQLIENPEYLVYLPSGMDTGKRYPLVIAFSPGADAQSMINTWADIADEYKWIIFASREFRNGIDTMPVFSRIADSVGELCSRIPIDPSRIIATGLSGGGMGSYSFAYLYPNLIAAVVVNTGMMHPQLTGIGDRYPKAKTAVFLASPTDFRYAEMKRDRVFLDGLGWKTKWIEFSGGHITAPASSYQEAAAWLSQQLKR